jgi:hypothetical protein
VGVCVQHEVMCGRFCNRMYLRRYVHTDMFGGVAVLACIVSTFFVCISTYVHIRTCVYVTHKRMYIICVRSGSVRMCQVW